MCLSVCLYICIILYLYSNFSFLKRIDRVFQYTNIQSDSGEGILCEFVVPLSCKSFCCELTILFFFSIKITGDQLSTKNNNINNNNNNILINRNMTNSLTTTTSYNNKQQTRVRYRMFYKISPFFVFCSLLLCF